MTILGTSVTAAVMEKITAPDGMNAGLAELDAPYSTLAQPVSAEQVRAQNVAADVAEQSGMTSYPSLNVYCEKITNKLTEKFRSFSGSIQMTVEVRHSQDRLEGLETALELYVDSVTQVLDGERGDWGGGMYYAGGYEITLGPVKHGGRNFIQAAKITFQVQASIN